MQSVARLVSGLGVIASLAACSGGYPIPPTRCDEWCETTKGGICATSYDPAGCVNSCEQSHLGDARCRSELEAALACFRANPRALECSFSNATPPCSTESQLLSDCASKAYLPVPEP